MNGRPVSGIGHYLRDIIYGSLDGVITTIAVVAGSAGAGLGIRVALILGLANLVADGLSMGASNYLGLKSELQQTGSSVRSEQPWRHGLATALAFAVAGSIPLSGLAVPTFPGGRLAAASFLGALVLLAVGAGRAKFLPLSRVRASAEMLFVGVLAGGAAYLVGAAAHALI